MESSLGIEPTIVLVHLETKCDILYFFQFNSGRYVFGGISGKQLIDLGDLQVLDTETMTWTEIKTERSPEPRCGHVLFVHNEKMYTYQRQFYS